MFRRGQESLSSLVLKARDWGKWKGDGSEVEEEEEEDGNDNIRGIHEAKVKEEVADGAHGSASSNDTAFIQNVSFFLLTFCFKILTIPSICFLFFWL